MSTGTPRVISVLDTESPRSGKAVRIESSGTLLLVILGLVSATVRADCPTNGCCTVPPATCCGSPDLCALDLGPVPPGASACQGVNGFAPELLQFDLAAPFGPPELPPAHVSPALSNWPLISRPVTGTAPRPHPALPVHGNTVDLVLGRPLVRAVDFELPFGRAVFRHVRTYGADVSFDWSADDGETWSFWDWNGTRWLMSENPILLIDAQFEISNLEGVQQAEMPQRRCYFIPDGQQAIPFLFVNNGTQSAYTAPSYLDATLGHNGTFDEAGDWDQRPTEFHVWLDRGNLKYTFRAVWEDVSTGDHLPPSEGGRGKPYYGLLQRVEDRLGHRMDIEYCGFFQVENDCLAEWRVIQTCAQKGQIKSIKLYPPDATAPAWTLVYYHQLGACYADGETMDECEPAITAGVRMAEEDRHVRSIFVYEGDVPELDAVDCLTLPSAFCDPGESIRDRHTVYPLAPDNWTIQAEYTYVDPVPAFRPYDVTSHVTGWPGRNNHGENVLTGVTVRRRTGIDAEIAEQHTLYRYHADSAHGERPALKMVLNDGTIQSILATLQAEPGADPACNGTVNDANADLFSLYGLGDRDLLCRANRETGALETEELRFLATHYFEYFRGATIDGCGDSGGNWRPAWVDFMNRYGDDGPWRAEQKFVHHPVEFRASNTGDPAVDGQFRYVFISQFPSVPDDCAVGCTDSEQWDAHTPYYTWAATSSSCSDPVIPAGDRVRHLAIIDTVRDRPTPWYHAEYPELLTRRVVGANAQGFVLKNQSFDFESNPAGTLTERVGHAERRRYNADGRLIEVRSAAWDSDANAATRDSAGLIRFFEYGACDGNEPGDGELACEGVMLGTNGANRWYTALYEHGAGPARGDLVTRAVRFRTPVTLAELASVDLADHEVTLAKYEFADDPLRPGQITAEAQLTKTGREVNGSSGGPSGDVWFMTRKFYDDRGQPTWSGAGEFATAAAEPDLPTTEQMISFFPDWRAYNERGAITEMVMDIASTEAPPGFARIDPDGTPPLALTTTYGYDALNRLTRVTKPGNRSDWILYDLPAGMDRLATWSFEDVVLCAGSGTYRVDKPVKIQVTDRNGRPEEMLEVDVVPASCAPTGLETYTILARSGFEFDSYGRFAGVNQHPDANTNSGAVQTRIAYDAFGQVNREQGPDGTIARTVRSMRGRVEAIYRGTRDLHSYWGMITPEDEPDDNMVLVEKRFYGDGTDARGGANATGQVLTVQEYNQQPANPYREGIPADEDYIVNDENSNGTRTVVRYDGRVRPVHEEHWSRPDANGQRVLLHRVVTWYDHLDRVRLTADFGATPVPAAVDPLFGPHGLIVVGEDATAWVTAIRDAGPTALRETVYDKAGLVAAERDYLLEPGDLAFTTTTYTYNGRGLTIGEQSPGGGRTRSVYDALGRLIKQQVLADVPGGGALEVERMEYVYDPLGNRQQERVRERRAGAMAADLDDPTDYVQTYRHQWFNPSNQLIATADYGTNDASDQDIYATGPAPAYDPDDPPTHLDLPAALVTRFDYDARGRQYRVTDPRGVVTETMYDGLDRVLMVTDNADGPSSAQRRTAYRFEEDTGRLVSVAAVTDPAITAYDAVWSAESGVQVTAYAYDATIVNAGTAGFYAVSTNGAWISAVHYPDPETGQPAGAPTVTFAYRHDGKVARRTDARGVTLGYTYDDQDRLAATEVLGSVESIAHLELHAWRQAYDYWPDGQLRSAVTLAADGAVLAEVDFAYDASHRLFEVSQQFAGGPIHSTTLDWEFAPQANDERLTGITYPSGAGVTHGYEGIVQPAAQVDDVLSRLTSIGTGSLDFAYRYMGRRRLVGHLAGAHARDFDAPPGSGPVIGLDRFGRVKDLAFVRGGEIDVHVDYGYDASGNRTHARVANIGTERSWVYSYDGLNRLVRASRGALNAAADGFVDGSAVESRTWALDLLGNWSAGAVGSNSFHVFDDWAGDGVFDAATDMTVRTAHHAVNAVNEIDALSTVDAAGDGAWQHFVHDAVGNLVFDGRLYYRYGPWNRLMSVLERGALAADAAGLLGDPAVDAGPVVEQFDHDALGRRVRTHVRPGQVGERITRHVYGAGPAVLEDYDEDPGTGRLTLARTFVHGTHFPDPLMMVDYTDAGAAPAGTSESFYYLKDAQGSVLAVVDAAGSVVERYAYDPYGRTTVTDAAGTPQYAPLTGVDRTIGHYHDHDDDGDIDLADWAHLQTCMGAEVAGASTSGLPDVDAGSALPGRLWCVFVHDRDGDHTVDAADVARFAEFTAFDPQSPTVEPAPSIFERPWPRWGTFDVDADGRIDLYDVYGFQACLGSVAGGHELCAIYDVTGDGFITTADYAAVDAATGDPLSHAAPPGRTPSGHTTSRIGNPYAYTGQRYDDLTAHIHFWARTYNANLGRWLQRDMMGLLSPVTTHASAESSPTVSAPVISAGSEYIGALNLYVYALAGPTVYTDAFGLNVYEEWGDQLLAERAGSALAFTQAASDIGLGVMQVAGQIAVEALITAIVPGGSLLVSAYHLRMAGQDVRANGWNLLSGISVAGAAAGITAYALNSAHHFASGYRTSRRVGAIRHGSFSITNWSGYPRGVPRPKGPFRIVRGAEYRKARMAANNANAALRRANPQKYADKHIHEIHPVKFGGSPTDPANKIAIDPSTHHMFNSWWYRMRGGLENGG